MDNVLIEQIKSVDTLKMCAPILVDAYNSEPWNDAWTTDKAYEKLACFFASPKFYGFTASINGEIIGCCVGNVEPYFSGDYFYLKEMFVSVKVQRKQVGSRLMSFLRETLSTVGIDTVVLFTSKYFFPFQFYLKEGFEEMEGMCMMHLQMQD